MKLTHPVLSCEESADWENIVLAGRQEKEWTAMCRAGSAIGRGVLQDWRETGLRLADRPILILCGKGHNGGDALLAAKEIIREIPAVRLNVLFTEGERSLRPMVMRAWRELQALAAESVAFDTLTKEDSVEGWLDERFGKGDWSVCLDGVLGLRFKPPLRPRLSGLFRWVNCRARIVLRAAVDLPSGVGDQSAAEPLRADFTYMPGMVKLPSLSPGLEKWTGRLRYIDLGFFDNDEPSRPGNDFGKSDDLERRVIHPSVLDPLLGLRDPSSRKGSFGHLFLVGGSRTLAGAVLMSAMAAIRSGVGLVTAFVPQSLAAAFAARVPEAMWVPCPETPDGGLAMDALGLFRARVSRASSLVLGPGLGREAETHSLAHEILKETAVPVLLDADGLTENLVEAAASSNRKGSLVLTPHGGEFARITGMDLGRVGDPGLVEYAKRQQVIVVLKGPPYTRITDGSKLWYALNGGPVLARGGSGDILSGLMGGLMAAHRSDFPMDTVARAVYWQGCAADALAHAQGANAVATTDLIGFLGRSLRGR